MGESRSADPASPAGGKHEGSSDRLQRPEQRRFSRFRVDEATVRLHLKGFLTSLGICLRSEARSAVNLSEGGILVVTRARFKAGTGVRVRMELEKYKDIIQADGRVRWCYPSARDETAFYTGIEFHDLPSAHAALIGQMRAWFTSPEFKQKSATRRRLAPP